MSQCSNPGLPTHPTMRPWTEYDRVCCGMVLLLAYMISPPWVALLFHTCQAPQWVFHFLTLFYAPLTSACAGLPALDTLYTGYKDLLKPWMLGA
jgi:hypothetical protein